MIHASRDTTPAVVARGLTRSYPNGVLGLPPIDLSIKAATLVALRGRSGSGKTTLLNLVGALDRPTAGSLHVLGTDVVSLSDRERTDFRRSAIGFVFQNDGLVGALSAIENVELGLRIIGRGRSERIRRSVDAIERVGLADWSSHRPSQLSGGQRQRVALARAIAITPRLLIADEPTGELDQDTGAAMLQLIRTLVVEDEVTALIGTHDPAVDEIADVTIDLQEHDRQEHSRHQDTDGVHDG